MMNRLTLILTSLILVAAGLGECKECKNYLSDCSKYAQQGKCGEATIGPICELACSLCVLSSSIKVPSSLTSTLMATSLQSIILPPSKQRSRTYLAPSSTVEVPSPSSISSSIDPSKILTATPVQTLTTSPSKQKLTHGSSTSSTQSTMVSTPIMTLISSTRCPFIASSQDPTGDRATAEKGLPLDVTVGLVSALFILALLGWAVSLILCCKMRRGLLDISCEKDSHLSIIYSPNDAKRTKETGFELKKGRKH